MARTVNVGTICILVATFLSTAMGCAVPPFGCSRDFCRSLSNPPAVSKPRFNKDSASTYDTRLGFWMGLYNKRYTEAQKRVLLRTKGGPSINYESFSEIGFVVKYSTATSLRACCDDCRVTNGCWMYQYFDYESSTGRPNPKGFRKGTRCYLLKGGNEKVDNAQWGTPYSGRYSEQVTRGDAYSPVYNPSWVGGLCNGNTSVVDDPHFTGALGTPFDFNGELDKAFCLTTDERLHINVVLKGYKDTSAESAKGIRSWIKEVGIMWTDARGASHTVHLVARSGKQQERGDGFLASVFVDGEQVAVPSLDAPLSYPDSGLSFAFLGTGKTGPYDIDRFSLKIESLLDLGVALRVAHPKLQTPDDAEVHFNLALNDISASDKIHGVLGQTYRATAEQQQKALKYSEIARLVGGRVAADGKSGKGFLEGETTDYETTGVLSANCRFSAFSA